MKNNKTCQEYLLLLDNKLHAIDKPAIQYSDGSMEYWVNGMRHNPNGAALIRPNGYMEYWMYGKYMGKRLESGEYIVVDEAYIDIIYDMRQEQVPGDSKNRKDERQ